MIPVTKGFMFKNCAVLERSGDGDPVGRCFFHLGDNDTCPRHGDVSEIQQHYRETGQLSEDPRDAKTKRAVTLIERMSDEQRAELREWVDGLPEPEKSA